MIHGIELGVAVQTDQQHTAAAFGEYRHGGAQ
jgi:hypothetical protein